MSSAIQLIQEDIYGLESTFNSVLAEKSIHFETEAHFAIQIISNNSYLLGIASANRQSVVDAVTNLAAIGLSLNPAKKQAYLVPRKKAVCLDISYIGMTELAVSSGSVMFAKAELVRERDQFVLNGFDKAPTHIFEPYSNERGDVVGVYCVAKTIHGDYLTDTMTIKEVNDIRDRSESYKGWKADNSKSCPWITDPGEMIKKTVIKRGSKLWPKTPRLDQAIHYLNTDGGEGLSFANDRSANQAPGLPVFDDKGWIGKAKLAKTEAELTSIYSAAMRDAADAKDRSGAERFKFAALQRRKQIRDENTVDMEQPS